MGNLLILDHQIFWTINHLPHTIESDTIAEFLSGIGTFGLIWFLIGILLFFREERRDHRFFIPILTVGVTVLVLVELIIKPIIARLRPSDIVGTIVVVGAAGYSFPSGHATMSWAMATVLAQYEPKMSVWLYTLATLISLSRIYLGVHYPVDIIFGAILGVCVARIGLFFTAHHIRKKITARGKF